MLLFRLSQSTTRRLRRKIRCKNLTLFLPSQQAKTGPPLTPLLGQSGINAAQFCLFFNKYTVENLTDEPPFFPLNTKVGSLGGNKFLLTFRLPSTNFLLYNYLFETRRLSPLLLYKVLLIKARQNEVKATSLFGTLKSLRLRHMRPV